MHSNKGLLIVPWPEFWPYFGSLSSAVSLVTTDKPHTLVEMRGSSILEGKACQEEWNRLNFSMVQAPTFGLNFGSLSNAIRRRS